MRRWLAALAVVAGGCSAIDLSDPPAFDFPDRPCAVDADCAGLPFTDRNDITADDCVEVRAFCNAGARRCDLEVTIRDADGDDARDPACTSFGSLRPRQVDCDDANPLAYPGDRDGDGHRAAGCPGDTTSDDCDDTNSLAYPGAPEACDGAISDCNATGGGGPRLLEDRDGDEFAPPGADCDDTVDDAFPKEDCDDTNPLAYPGAPEACDGVVDACVGDQPPAPRPDEDQDGDGVSLPDAPCDGDIPGGFPKNDCDDTAGTIYPGAPELCDRIFNDCAVSTGPRPIEDFDGDGRASFAAPCLGGPIPRYDCIGADNDPTTRFCRPIEQAPITTVLVSPRSVALVDFRDDGDLDVLAIGSGSVVRLWENTLGTGTDWTERAISGTTGEMMVRSGDVDRDGFDDFLTMAPATGGLPNGSVRWYRATGPTSYTVGVAYATGIEPDSILFLENLSQGFAGFAVTVPTGVLLYVWTGASFAALVHPTSSTPVIASTDVDADDRNELLVAVGTTLTIVDLPDAGPLVVNATAGGTLPSSADYLGAGDLDGDGDFDVVLGDDAGPIAVAQNDGAGGFTEREVTLSTATGLSGMEVTDFDGDGLPDIVVVTEFTDAISWWRPLDSILATWTRHDVVGDFDDVRDVAVGDIDGDGDRDLVAPAFSANLVSWWRSSFASGLAWTPRRIDRAFGGARGVSVADFDGDGDVDVAGVASSENEIVMFENLRGDASQWAPRTVVAAYENPIWVEDADLDGDGAQDLVGVSAASSAPTISWFERTSAIDAPWERRDISTTLPRLSQVEAADLDGDGDVDLVATAAFSSLVVWLENDGSGTSFVEHSLTTTSMSAEGLAVGDLDGDTDLDVLYGNPSGAVVAQVNGGQAASFTEMPLGTVPVVVGTLRLADIDDDADLDFLAGGFGSAEVLWVEQVSPGVFATHSLPNPGVGVASIMPVDLDADGDLDVLGALPEGGAGSPTDENLVRWWENLNGDGVLWVARDVDRQFLNASSVASGDFDGDGFPDVVAAASDGSDVTAWLSDGATWWNPLR